MSIGVLVVLVDKSVAIPGLPGGLIIYQGTPSISPERTPTKSCISEWLKPFVGIYLFAKNILRNPGVLRRCRVRGFELGLGPSCDQFQARRPGRVQRVRPVPQDIARPPYVDQRQGLSAGYGPGAFRTAKKSFFGFL